MAFWIAAAVMTAAVAALLLWPARRPPADGSGAVDADLAVYRDQLAEVERDLAQGLIEPDQAEAARIEISRRMLAAAGRGEAVEKGDSRRTRAVVLAVAVLLPLAAVALYLPGGRPDLPSQPFAARDSGERDRLLAELADAEALARRLQEAPDDLAGWVELGRRYRVLGRPVEAVAAYARAVGLAEGDPEITGSYAEVLVEAGNGMVTEQAVAAFESVLQTRPGDPRARYYLALARAQAGDDQGALARWQALAADSPAGAPWLPTVETQIRRTAERLGLDPDAQVPAPSPGPSAADIAAAEAMSGEERAAMIRDMVEGLAARLETEPDDLEGWARLGNAYQVLGEPERAAEAWARAADLDPDNPDILAAYGDALLATEAGATLAPEFISVMERLLALDENDTRALWFLGAKALAGGDAERATALWRRLLAQLEPGTDGHATVTEFLARAEAAAGGGAEGG